MKLIFGLDGGLSSKQSFTCTICPLARQTRLPFPDSSIQSTHSFQLIHIDTWSSYSTPTHSGFKYFLTIVDDYTRATWTYLMGAKSNAFDLLKAFIFMVETQFQTKVQTVRNDNDLELGSGSFGSLFFSEKGIIHQTSYPHTPQQNGVVERKYMNLLEIARALLFQSHLPIIFWGDCLLTTTYLINRFPSPFSITRVLMNYYLGRLLFILISGLLAAFATQHRSIPCVCIGYLFGKRVYKLYNLSTKSCFVSRDVIFHERIFPFSKSSVCSCPAIPSSFVPGQYSDDSHSSLSSPVPDPSPQSSLTPTPPSPPSSSPGFNVSSFSSSIPPSVLHFSPPPLRRSGRPHIVPAYLQDYDAAIPEWQDVMRKEFEALKDISKHQCARPYITIPNVLLHQKKFVLDLVDSFASSAIVCPLAINEKRKASVGMPLTKPEEYRCLVALHLLRYLKGSFVFGLFFSNSSDLSLKVYCDSDWASCADSRRSVTGFCVFLGDSLVSRKFKKHPVVSFSSAETEYRAISKAAAEVTWLSRLFSDFYLPSSSHIPLYCDNQAALYIARNLVFHERTKHIELNRHFVTGKIGDGWISLGHVSSDAQV
ncbi:uncharacterized protein LOC142166962 [Nicotiana tabacum]|uniref:Uncharacterized protein LOC142166962 n=1 Tax=Nicotiana tabacum TaxID=4097 RepID=A0AC58SDS8_TOBAC